jgi:hypothetical protein
MREKRVGDDNVRARKKSEYEFCAELSGDLRDEGRLGACAERNWSLRRLRLFLASLTPPG